MIEKKEGQGQAMRQDRPLATLKERFPATLQPVLMRPSQAPLELRLSSQHRLVVSRLGENVLLEVEQPAHSREGRWGVVVQLRLDGQHLESLLSFLMKNDEPPKEAA